MRSLQVKEAKSSLALFITKTANSSVDEGAKWGSLTVGKHGVRSAMWEESLGSPDFLVCQGKQRYPDFNMTYSDFQRLATHSNFSTLCERQTLSSQRLCSAPGPPGMTSALHTKDPAAGGGAGRER